MLDAGNERIFEYTGSLFEKYLHSVIQHNKNYYFDEIRGCLVHRDMDQNYLATEVLHRIRQLDFIVKKIFSLNILAVNINCEIRLRLDDYRDGLKKNGIERSISFSEAGVSDSDIKALEDAVLEIEVLAESFYYIAFRVRQALINKKHQLPGLKNFECKGIRDVRNHLIEHVEASGALVKSFGYGLDKGPQIKPYNSFNDDGLYKNAKEFCENLNRLLLAAIGEVENEQ